MAVAEPTTYLLSDTDLVLGELEEQYVLKVKDLPEQEKPREKLLALGPAHLTLPELMAIIWGVGTRKEEVLAMAKRTIKEYGERTVVNEHSAVKLAQIADIPLAKACQVVASFELGRRFYAKTAGKAAFIRTTKQAKEYLKDIGFSQKEQLRGLYLGSRHQIVHDEVISVGSLTSNVVHPREVFQPAIEHRAVAVIVAHNHPSGSLEPTQADLKVTKQLKQAGQVLGIELLDHLIIAGNKHVSIINLDA